MARTIRANATTPSPTGARSRDYERVQPVLVSEDVEHIPPPKPRRDEDGLHEAAGQSLMARDFDRRVAELHVRAAILNGDTTLGIPFTKAMG